MRTALTHGQPGDWLLRAFTPLTTAIGYLAGVSADDAGEYMWHAVHSGEKGMYRRDKHGEDIGNSKLYTDEETLGRGWEHTLVETGPRT